MQLLLSAAVSAGAKTNLHSRDVTVDTNILLVKFNVLTEVRALHTGDPVVCQNEKCTAMLNHLSHISEIPGKDKRVHNYNIQTQLTTIYALVLVFVVLFLFLLF